MKTPMQTCPDLVEGSPPAASKCADSRARDSVNPVLSLSKGSPPRKSNKVPEVDEVEAPKGAAMPGCMAGSALPRFHSFVREVVGFSGCAATNGGMKAMEGET